ncbi:MAG: hypothetical protein ACTSX8_03185 [Alphaproteobacteria bacterium]
MVELAQPNHGKRPGVVGVVRLDGSGAGVAVFAGALTIDGAHELPPGYRSADRAVGSVTVSPAAFEGGIGGVFTGSIATGPSGGDF